MKRPRFRDEIGLTPWAMFAITFLGIVAFTALLILYVETRPEPSWVCDGTSKVYDDGTYRRPRTVVPESEDCR